MRKHARQRIKELEEQAAAYNKTLNYERYTRFSAERRLRELTCRMVPFRIKITIPPIEGKSTGYLREAHREAARRIADGIFDENCFSISQGIVNETSGIVSYTVSITVFKP